MNNQFKIKLVMIAIINGFFSLYAMNSFASGSELFLDNVSGLGNAYSGKAAIADDASTEYFNPAGLSRFTHPQLVLGSVVGRFNGNYHGSDNYSIPPLVFIPQSGYVNGQPTYAPYPFLYYVHPINEKLTLGLGVFTPYGIGISIPDTSIVRYSGTRAIMYVIDFSPALAYKINNQWSAGVGLDLQRLAYTTVAMSPSVTLGGPDARIRNDAIGWGYGWHSGLLYDMTPKTRAGLAFHSQTIFRPEGQSKYTFAPGSNVGSEIISNNFKFSQTLPATTTFSLYHDVNPRWAVMSTVDYSNWSSTKQTVYYNIALATSTGAPSQITSVAQQHYKNTWRLALGTNIKATQKWMLRFGLSVETDNTNANYRPLTDPSNANKTIAAGFHYQGWKTVGFDFGYQHFFMQPSSTHTVNGNNIENGTVKLQRDVAGLQATWDIV